MFWPIVAPWISLVRDVPLNLTFILNTVPGFPFRCTCVNRSVCLNLLVMVFWANYFGFVPMTLGLELCLLNCSLSLNFLSAFPYFMIFNTFFCLGVLCLFCLPGQTPQDAQEIKEEQAFQEGR